MTIPKRQLASFYYGHLMQAGHNPICNQEATTPDDRMRHLCWMCTQIVAHVDENPEKYDRWLGFIQGVLWAQDVFTIEQLRRHVIGEMV